MPIHRGMRSGSVSQPKTTSGGAPIRIVRSIVASSATALPPALTLGRGLEQRQAVVPHLLEEGPDLGKGLGERAIVTPCAVLPLRYESGLAQHAQMLGDRLARHVEFRSDRTRRH